MEPSDNSEAKPIFLNSSLILLLFLPISLGLDLKKDLINYLWIQLFLLNLLFIYEDQHQDLK